MSLENELKKNTEALIGLAQALAAQSEKGTVPARESAQASPAASAPVSLAPTVEIPAVPAGEVIDKKQIIQAVIKLAQDKGTPPAKAVIAQFGASKASELNDVAQYPAILAALQAATAAK